MDEVLQDQIEEGVVRLTLNRPKTLNSLSVGLVDDLHDRLARIEHDASVRVVVITGAGRGFCSGIDLNGYGVPAGYEDQGNVQQGLATQRQIVGLVQRIRRLPQVVIAAVNGPAAGGGLALVLASDVRIASESADFMVAFSQIGVTGCDIGTSWMLPRLVGAGRAHELILTGRRFDAAEALEMGLLARVVPADELFAAVRTCAQALLRKPPLSLSLTKQGMWLSMEIPSFDAAIELENRQQIMTMVTADRAEALASFLEHRAPVYTNS